jgi:hypothetical protein
LPHPRQHSQPSILRHSQATAAMGRNFLDIDKTPVPKHIENKLGPDTTAPRSPERSASGILFVVLIFDLPITTRDRLNPRQ